MATKTPLFRPVLREPRALNNYPGVSFRCFTKGDTLAFKFTFKDQVSGDPIDVTGWTMTVAFSDKQYLKDCGQAQGATQIEVDIPINDAVNGIFQGEVATEKTELLKDGITYAVAYYEISGGERYILDMAMLEVYPNLVCSQE